MEIQMFKGGPLEVMRRLEGQSIDMVITAIPYTKANEPPGIALESLWNELRRVVKPNGAILLFGQEPFNSILRTSQLSMFQYDWIWEKSYPGNFVAAGFQPLRFHETVSVFSPERAAYYPIKESKLTVGLKRLKGSHGENPALKYAIVNFDFTDGGKHPEELRFPSSIQFCNNRSIGKRLHPQQKPMDLLEYLIKTHSKVGDTVLDFCAGAGDTGIAAHNLNRKYVGIEAETDYYLLAKSRIDEILLG